MFRHVGIVACSAEGAALCFRTLVHESARLLGRYVHPEITMHAPPFSEYMAHIEAGDWDAVGRMMASSAALLADAGAEILVCPDNTIHQAFDLAAAAVSLPWLHIAEVVAAEAARRGFRRVGVTGTRYLMEGPVYPDKLAVRGIDSLVPGDVQRLEINRIIFEELVNGDFRPVSIRYFVDVIGEMQSRGCEAVVLGCTEIPLVITEDNSPLPVLDSTRLLARAAVHAAIGAGPAGP
ncbi:MAG: amino acid racemase [Planctomycetes bacterium]|nr:amino acid racemase [Planctomycetota bacterium]